MTCLRWLCHTLCHDFLAASIPKHLRHSRPQHSLSSACPEFQHLSENKLTKFHIGLFEVTWSTEAPIPNHPKSFQLFCLRLLRLWDPPRNDVSEPHVTTKSWHPQRKLATKMSRVLSAGHPPPLFVYQDQVPQRDDIIGQVEICNLPLPPWHKIFEKIGDKSADKDPTSILSSKSAKCILHINSRQITKYQAAKIPRWFGQKLSCVRFLYILLVLVSQSSIFVRVENFTTPSFQHGDKFSAKVLSLLWLLLVWAHTVQEKLLYGCWVLPKRVGSVHIK